MDNIINQELAKLHEQMLQLDVAVRHITKAESLTTEVINAAKLIEQKYGEQLQLLFQKYDELLKNVTSHTENNIDQVAQSHLSQIEEVKRLIVEYRAGVDTTRNENSNLLDQALKSFNSAQQQTIATTESRIDALHQALQTHSAEAQRLLQTFKTNSDTIKQDATDNLHQGLDAYQLALTSSLNETGKQINELTQAHKLLVQEAQNTVTQSQNLVQDSSIQNRQRLDEALDNYKTQLKQSLTVIQDKINELSNAHIKQIDEVDKLINEYKEFLNQVERDNQKRFEKVHQQYEDFLSRSYTHNEKKISEVVDSVNKQTAEVRKLLTEYVEIVLITSKLHDKIDNVDFPVRLTAIDSAMQATNQEIATVLMRVENLEMEQKSDMQNQSYELNTKLEKQDKQIATLKWLLIFVAVVAVAVLAMVIVK